MKPDVVGGNYKGSHKTIMYRNRRQQGLLYLAMGGVFGEMQRQVSAKVRTAILSCPLVLHWEPWTKPTPPNYLADSQHPSKDGLGRGISRLGKKNAARPAGVQLDIETWELRARNVSEPHVLNIDDLATHTCFQAAEFWTGYHVDTVKLGDVLSNPHGQLFVIKAIFIDNSYQLLWLVGEELNATDNIDAVDTIWKPFQSTALLSALNPSIFERAYVLYDLSSNTFFLNTEFPTTRRKYLLNPQEGLLNTYNYPF